MWRSWWTQFLRRELVIGVLLVFGAQNANAIPTGLSVYPDSTSDGSPVFRWLQGFNLGVRAEEFLSRPEGARKGEPRTYVDLGIRRTLEVYPQYNLGVDLGGSIGLSSQAGQIAYAHEGYIERSSLFRAGDRATLGRKKQDWNKIDQFWELGLWEPRFRWNPVSPEREGLTGLFWNLRSDEYEFLAFATAFYIPEQGPSFRVDEGKFVSDSPYFVAPSSEVSIFSTRKDILYKLEIPSLEKLVFHPGAALSFRAGRLDRSWLRAGYAYKPLNQLLINYNGYHRVDFDAVQVNVSPYVEYHHLASLETGRRIGKSESWLGVIAEIPEKTQPSQTETVQQVLPSIAASAGTSLNFAEDSQPIQKVDLSYLQQWGGRMKTFGEQAAEGVFSESHFPFRNALSVRFQSGLLGRKLSNLALQTRYTYDFSVQGSVLSTEVTLPAARNLTVSVGGELLGVGAKGSGDLGTIPGRYRAVDRVTGGLRYVF